MAGEESPETPNGEAQEPETTRSAVQKFLKAGIGVKAGAAAAVVVVLVGVVAVVQVFNRESTNTVNEEEQIVQEIGGETEETVETAQETAQEAEEAAEELQEETAAENADFTELAVGDSLEISDNKYWLVGEDGKWGYVDHDGKKQEMFDDASEFVNGKAMVIKDGKAYYIDESFQCSENGIEADGVYTYGEMFIVLQGDRWICLSAGE